MSGVESTEKMKYLAFFFSATIASFTFFAMS